MFVNISQLRRVQGALVTRMAHNICCVQVLVGVVFLCLALTGFLADSIVMDGSTGTTGVMDRRVKWRVDFYDDWWINLYFR